MYSIPMSSCSAQYTLSFFSFLYFLLFSCNYFMLNSSLLPSIEYCACIVSDGNWLWDEVKIQYVMTPHPSQPIGSRRIDVVFTVPLDMFLPYFILHCFV